MFAVKYRFWLLSLTALPWFSWNSYFYITSVNYFFRVISFCFSVLNIFIIANFLHNTKTKNVYRYTIWLYPHNKKKRWNKVIPIDNIRCQHVCLALMTCKRGLWLVLHDLPLYAILFMTNLTLKGKWRHEAILLKMYLSVY